jgi:8-oxo-dGTP diphosphatase
MRIHVAAAVIVNNQGEVLISLRPDHVHQGGLWEFPGGKLEPGEDIQHALARELREELDITVKKARPLIRIPYDYQDKAVLLDVWRVSEFLGEPHGHEGQPIRWVAPELLTTFQFPAANEPIVLAARLPSVYLITGELVDTQELFLEKLVAVLRAGIRLIQFRVKTLDESQYAILATEALKLCQSYDANMLVNATSETALKLDAHGVHLSSERLMQLQERPLPKNKWVAASCHNDRQLQHAVSIGVDFVVISPVLPTGSHPGAETLGWSGLKALTEQAMIPVYALGGMRAEHMTVAFTHGAQGVALISAVWNASDVQLAAREFLGSE